MKITLQDIAQYQHLDLIAQQLVDGFITGLHKSPYHGFSVEFAEHKLYNIGESTRHIDWRVFARTDKLFTKQFEEETNLRCHLVIDQSPSMYYPKETKDKLRFSILCAASIAHLLVKQRDAVGLTLFSDKINYQSQQKSTRTHLHQLMTELGQTMTQEMSGQTNIVEVLHEIAEKIQKRSLVVLFSDMFQQGNVDELYGSLQHLKHNLHEVILFHVSEMKTELSFDFPDRPTKFVDLETNEVLRVNPHQIRESYQLEMAKFYKEIKIRCGMLKIDFIDVNTADPFNKVLGAFLIKRKRMG